MKSIPMLPGFYLPCRGRKARTAQQLLSEKIAKQRKNTFKQLGEIFGQFLPQKILNPEQNGAMSRQRLFTKENTFWAFFGQVLDADGGCKEVVRKLQSYASNRGLKIPSSSTASYCTARKRLSEDMLKNILEHTASIFNNTQQPDILNNRRVIVVDGTGISMPDTAENQEIWPQTRAQKPGCGFPSARICACFSLNTGLLLSYKIGNKKNHELPLFRKQWQTFKAGDIFLGDKGFCSYFDIANLQKQGIDSVVTLARRAPVRKRDSLKEISPGDLLISWERPKYNRKLSYPMEEWEKLPKELVLRQIRVVVNNPGSRVKWFHIVTTLLDSKQYPDAEIAELYLRRWNVELFFRDIKTTMGMDILRCKSPDMIRKEILIYFIAYNCIRRLMNSAQNRKSPCVFQIISFKGSIQAIRSWAPFLDVVKTDKAERRKVIEDLYKAITSLTIRQRPGRSEPRCLKRRPKNYQLLTAPRHEMKEIKHRNKYCAAST